MNAIAGFNAAGPLTLLGANVLAQILLVVLLAWALARTVVRHDPAIRHGIWVCALFCVLASPLAAWIMDSAGVTLVAIPVATAELSPAASAPAIPAQVAAFQPSPPTSNPHSAAGRLDRLQTPAGLTQLAGVEGRALAGSTGTVKSLKAPAHAELSGTGSGPSEQRPLQQWVRTRLGIAGMVWVVGVTFLLARLIYGCLAIRSLRRELSWTVPPSLDEIGRDACRILGVDRLPPVALTPATAGPLTMGVLHPVVVLPEDLVHQLNRRQLRDVLVHEFSHALRRDTLVGLLQRLAEVLFWPHPMVYVLNRELAEAREELCDNFVLRQADAPDYAETLMLIAESFLPGRRPAMVALLEHRGGLERRVAGLLDEKRKVTTRLHRGIAAALVAGFFATAVLVAGTRLLHAEPKGPADVQANKPTGQPPLALDLSAFYPARKFSRPAMESYSGRQAIDGLPFEVRCQIFLYGQTPAARGQVLPETLKGIRIGRTFDELHLIHQTSWPGVDGEAVAYIELNYADGTKSILPIRYGRQILDYFYLPSFEQEAPTDPDTKVCWRHAPLQYLAPVRLFKSMLRNPSPAKVVETMDVVSARHLASYGLLAATVADRDPTRPVTPPVPATQPDWKFDRELKIEVVDGATGKPVPGALVEPTLDVLEQWLAGSPFYTSAEGKGTIRYPLKTTSRVAFSVTKEGYDSTWEDWRGHVPDAFTVKLAPLNRPGTASSGSFLGTLRKWLGSKKGTQGTQSAETSPAAQKPAELIPPLAASVPRPSSVHIVAKMRTLSGDNFSLIVAKEDFVPVEIWREFGEKPKWRVEKPGRVAVMDGASTSMLIKPNFGIKFPQPSFGAFDSRDLLELADTESLITRQVRQARAKGWAVTQTHERTPAGEDRLRVTIEQKADVPEGDHNKNKWFHDSDLRWVYGLEEVDAKKFRLEDLEAYLHEPGGDVQILKVERVEYDQPIDPTVFSLKFPKDTVWYQEPQRLSDNAKYEKMSPLESARAFFEACGKGDLNESQKFCQYLTPGVVTSLKGLEIVSLGKPFQSKSYAGWFIPYEIKLRVNQRWTVRNDNPAMRWIIFLGPEETADVKALAGVERLPHNEKHEKMTPKEAVQALVDACRRNDPGEAKKFLPPSITAKEVETSAKLLAQAEIHVGECTPGKQPGQWVVSCELRVVKKHNLAMRKDNPAKRYIVDGGF